MRLIVDYGQKWEPQKGKESQTFQFGKAGLSNYGATGLLLASSFTPEKLEEMLGKEEANKIKEGDMIMHDVMLYCNDAKQDWVHSFHCLRATLNLIKERFPHITEVLIRSDGAGNFKCASSIFSMINLSKVCGLKIVEVSFSEGGNGKDYVDSLVQKCKQMIRYQIKSQPGGSACIALECVNNLAQGSVDS